LIVYKEGGRNKNPWGKRQGAYSSVSIHIGMNGGTLPYYDLHWRGNC
jgi:hypothetical protein